MVLPLEIQNEWFGEWFDSPYYHILYRNRDESEAHSFIDNLSLHLKLESNTKILDLACGKGRHSIYLNSKGFDVTGMDLSKENITHANQEANKHLRFVVQDMRQSFGNEDFSFILNMFTSFGYFESTAEHQSVISFAAKALKPGGKFVIDFLNPYTVINNLVREEVKIIDGIEFHILKSFLDGQIVKEINFRDGLKDYSFVEKVKAIRRDEFVSFFKVAKLKILNIFGDYKLNKYDPEKSDRMIFEVIKEEGFSVC